MSYTSTRPIPTEQATAKAWDQIMRLADAHALIVQAYGGVATLAMPDEQQKAGIREQTLRAGLFALEMSEATS